MAYRVRVDNGDGTFQEISMNKQEYDEYLRAKRSGRVAQAKDLAKGILKDQVKKGLVSVASKAAGSAILLNPVFWFIIVVIVFVVVIYALVTRASEDPIGSLNEVCTTIEGGCSLSNLEKINNARNRLELD